MTWNHRVVRRRPEGQDEYYAIHEVYSSEGDPDRCGSMTVDPVAVIGDDIEGLKWTLERMLEACDKPVIDYDAPDLSVYTMNGEPICEQDCS